MQPEAEIDAAFEKTYAAMEARVKKMLALPFEEFSTEQLTEALNKIGKTDD
jgi:arsenate reductase